MVEGLARIPYVRRCLLRRGQRRVEAVICNLSVVGLYVTFLRPLAEAVPEAGEDVGVTFLLPDDPVPVRAEANVTWQNLDEPEEVDSLPVGCGLRFASLGLEDQQRLGALVHDYCHAPQPRISAPPPHSGLIRIPYVQPCLLLGGDATWEGVVCNLSLLGVYVAADPIPPKGETVRLLFKIPRAAHPIDIPCLVVWENPHEPGRAEGLPPGCGLQFGEVDPSVRERLEELVLEYESVPRDGV